MTNIDVTDAATHDDFLDEEWLADTQRRSRGRVVLLTLLGVALTFLGGTQVQKHFGASGTQGASATTPGAGSGFPAGGPPGGAASGAGGAPQSAGGSGTSNGGSSGATSNSTAVIGEVVSIKRQTWIVKDLGGTQHRIHVTTGTHIVKEQSIAASKVKTGSTVNIAGTAEGASGVKASSITLR